MKIFGVTFMKNGGKIRSEKILKGQNGLFIDLFQNLPQVVQKCVSFMGTKNVTILVICPDLVKINCSVYNIHITNRN